MSIHSQRNLYPGVNAHLNSFLQQEGGGWESFHATHIEDIRAGLEAALPPNYYALTEKSLQLGVLDITFRTTRPKPDVTVFHHPVSTTPVASFHNAQPSLLLSLPDVLADIENDIMGIVVYEIEGGQYPGKPVTRIELLSPANKPGGSYYEQYLVQRRRAIESGLSLVEIDYLHETQPLIDRLPSYADQEEGAFPYMILVSDPRPQLAQGHFAVYGVSVDAPFPPVTVPLGAGEDAVLDLNPIYNATLSKVRIFRILVDYAQDPPHFDRYTPDDQARIRELLTSIRETHSPDQAE